MKFARNTALLMALLTGLWGCDLFGPREPKEEKTEEEVVKDNMPAHGVVDFIGVEGIAVDIHTSDAVTSKLGAPEVTNQSGSYLYYYYPSLGVKFNVNTTTDLVVAAYVYGEGWRYKISGAEGTYNRYTYATSQGIELNTPTSTMDEVLSNYGQPDAKGTLHDRDTAAVYPRYFRYHKDTLNRVAGMEFYFVGADTNDYDGKEITKINLF